MVVRVEQQRILRGNDPILEHLLRTNDVYQRLYGGEYGLCIGKEAHILTIMVDLLGMN